MANASRLIYLVGPSGDGKDSVLTQLKKNHYVDHQPVVAHRYITRPVEQTIEQLLNLIEPERA